MADSDNKMTKQEFIKALREMLDSISEAPKSKPQTPQPKAQDEMVWFSMNENGTDFLSSAAAPTQWAGDEPHEPQSPISPDLAVFLHDVSKLFSHALFTPIRSGRGRLSDFFHLVQHGKSVLLKDSYTPNERKVYEDWCKSIAASIDGVSSKGELWLSDSEEALVTSMKSGIFGGAA